MEDNLRTRSPGLSWPVPSTLPPLERQVYSLQGLGVRSWLPLGLLLTVAATSLVALLPLGRGGHLIWLV